MYTQLSEVVDCTIMRLGIQKIVCMILCVVVEGGFYRLLWWTNKYMSSLLRAQLQSSQQGGRSRLLI